MRVILLILSLLATPALAQNVRISPPSLPLSVANGGTADSGTAWTNYTPTVTCQTSGSLTSFTAAGRWKSLGKTTWLQININIATVGTCTGNLNMTLPASQIVNATGTIYPGAGFDNNSTLTPLVAYAASNVVVMPFSSAPAAHSYYVSATYEAN